MSTRPTPDIHEMVSELCRPHTHSEAYTLKVSGTTWHRRHTSRVPSLLFQLEHAAPSGRGSDRSTGFGSRPAALIEALDTLARIDLEASRWVKDLGEDDPLGTCACIQLLHGLHASAPPVTQRAIEADVRQWWTQARVVTGWDVAPFRPDNTCPECEKRGTLRLRVLDAYDASGFCVECRTTWSPAAIGLLAEHIRAENQEADLDDTQPASA